MDRAKLECEISEIPSTMQRVFCRAWAVSRKPRGICSSCRCHVDLERSGGAKERNHRMFPVGALLESSACECATASFLSVEKNLRVNEQLVFRGQGSVPACPRG